MAEVKETAATTAAAKKTSPAAKPVPTVRKFAPDDMIMCRSITHGELIFAGRKTQMHYYWDGVGDVVPVAYADLLAAFSMKSKFLTSPYFIIEDEDLVAQWGGMLKRIYESISHDSVEEMLRLPPAKLRQKLQSAPEGIKKSVKSMVAAQVVSGEFDSLSRIKVIDEVLGTELISMIS